MHKAGEMDGIGLVRIKWSTEFQIFYLYIGLRHSVTTPTMWRTVDSYEGTLACLGSELGLEPGWLLVSMVSAFSSSHCLLALSTRSLLRSLCMSERLA